MLKNKLKEEFKLTDEEVLRLELNMSKLIHSVTNDPNILKISTIDENKPKESQDRKTESDILEVFVRINRQGITLSRSDLIFSMLKLNWKESAEELPDFIRDINEGNNLGIDIDFVIRSLFTVSDLGSKFDVDLLRKFSNVEKVKENYERTCNAIKSLVDFMEDECNILNSSIIGGYLNLIPIVYYLANTPNNLVPNSEIKNLKIALYIFGFTKPFSRYADSRIGKFIREELKPLSSKDDFTFPLDSSIWWANYWEGYNLFDVKLLQKNRHLTLHLLQGKAGTKVKYERNAPEIDHIFPQSTLREKEYDWGIINSYGNFWILSKTKNQNKSNKHPKEYFADVDDSVLEKVFIDRHMLDYRQFTTFVKERELKILGKKN
ncbi:MAG: HNH endonuclease domain-containing protein [Saprospiraceae bacterium]